MATQRTIDTHTHILTLETAALITKASPKTPVTITAQDADFATLDVAGVVYKDFPTGGFDIARRLKDMDATGIDVHVLSATPQTYLYGLGEELSGIVATIQNDQMAKHVAAHPDRFMAIATLPLGQPERAADELKRVDYVQGVDITFDIWVLTTDGNEKRHVGEDELVAMTCFGQENGSCTSK